VIMDKKSKKLILGMSATELSARKSLLEKELVKYRLSLDLSSITVTGGYQALLKEIKSLARESARTLAVSRK
jgi:hypothetical protein